MHSNILNKSDPLTVTTAFAFVSTLLTLSHGATTLTSIVPVPTSETTDSNSESANELFSTTPTLTADENRTNSTTRPTSLPTMSPTEFEDEESTSPRFKRGYRGYNKRGGGGGHSTGIAYNRIHDSGQRRTVGPGHKGSGHYGHEEDADPLGEDGTHISDFKSYGVGYEHRDTNHCEESKCGYNIRHCPHGCVFNSNLCEGEGGDFYDTCCC